MPNITLADVAREAGVTPSTVSRVLNSKKGRVPISEATIRRVQEAAEKLGYVPSATARALRTGRLRSIGVLGADPNAYLEMERGGFMTEIFAGITAAAIRHGYHVSLLTG
ncbi:MAG: LacI family transcriptional regulator, partial [Lentisphaerae bacterium]